MSQHICFVNQLFQVAPLIISQEFILTQPITKHPTAFIERDFPDDIICSQRKFFDVPLGRILHPKCAGIRQMGKPMHLYAIFRLDNSEDGTHGGTPGTQSEDNCVPLLCGEAVGTTPCAFDQRLKNPPRTVQATASK
jgi:hypothetical protein